MYFENSLGQNLGSSELENTFDWDEADLPRWVSSFLIHAPMQHVLTGALLNRWVEWTEQMWSGPRRAHGPEGAADD